MSRASQDGKGAMPTFCILKDERPDLRLLFYAGAVSMLAFALMGFLIQVGGGGGFPEDLAHSAASDLNRSELVQGAVEQQAERDASLLTFQDKAVGSKLDTGERRRVLGAVIKNLKDHYFDHVLAQKMAHWSTAKPVSSPGMGGSWPPES
jgi:hypothetical protein